MATLALPADTVRFYNDGPDVPRTPDLQLAERHYRNAFLAGAREVAGWSVPNVFALAQIWDEREAARRAAEVRIPTSILFGHPHLDSEQIVYRVGHEVAASRTRGRCQALEMAKQLWWELVDAGLGDQQANRDRHLAGAELKFKCLSGDETKPAIRSAWLVR